MSTSTQAAPVSLPAAVEEKTAWLTWSGRILAVVIPVALWFAPLSLEPRVQHALAITSFMIVLH